MSQINIGHGVFSTVMDVDVQIYYFEVKRVYPDTLFIAVILVFSAKVDGALRALV